MTDKTSPPEISRRAFLGATTAIGAMAASGRGPAIAQSQSSRPTVISSGNGYVYRNGGSETCVERAYRMITEGTDVLDSLVAGVNIVELDPEDTSVGYGGLPDALGKVTLDSCCMHGPLKRAGGVAALRFYVIFPHVRALRLPACVLATRKPAYVFFLALPDDLLASLP